MADFVGGRRAVRRYCSTNAAPFSPIMIEAALVLAEVIAGVVEASITRKASMPRSPLSVPSTEMHVRISSSDMFRPNSSRNTGRVFGLTRCVSHRHARVEHCDPCPVGPRSRGNDVGLVRRIWMCAGVQFVISYSRSYGG